MRKVRCFLRRLLTSPDRTSDEKTRPGRPSSDAADHAASSKHRLSQNAPSAGASAHASVHAALGQTGHAAGRVPARRGAPEAPDRSPRGRTTPRTDMTPEARRRRFPTDNEATYLKQLDAAQTAGLNQRVRAKPAPEGAPRCTTRGTSLSSTPKPSRARDRAPVRKCDFSQMVHERPAEDRPLIADFPRHAAVATPVRKMAGVVRRASPALQVVPAPTACEEYDGQQQRRRAHPLLAMLNHSMQTQTSFHLDDMPAPDFEPSQCGTSAHSLSRTASSRGKVLSLSPSPRSTSSMPSPFPSRARLGTPAKSESNVSSAVRERRERCTSWPELPHAPTKTHSATNTLPTPTMERCVSTTNDVLEVRVHASACPGTCKPGDDAGVVVEQGVLDGQKGLVLSPVPSQNHPDEPPDDKEHNFLTVGAVGAPVALNVMPCVSWSHVPDALSMTDSVGMPLPDLRMRVIPYPCPCHPLDDIIKSKAVNKRTYPRHLLVVEGQDETGQSAREDSPCRSGEQMERGGGLYFSGPSSAVEITKEAPSSGTGMAPTPPLAHPYAERSTFGRFSQLSPPAEKMSMRSLAAIAGHGVFQTVKQASMAAASSAVPVVNPLVSFMSRAVNLAVGKRSAAYDAAEFTDTQAAEKECDAPSSADSLELGTAVQAGSQQCTQQPDAPVDAAAQQGAAGGSQGGSEAENLARNSYSPGDFSVRQDALNSKIDSIMSQISADLGSISAPPAPRPDSGSLGPEEDVDVVGSRVVLKANRRASMQRGKAASSVQQEDAESLAVRDGRAAEEDAAGAAGQDDAVTASEDDGADAAEDEKARRRDARTQPLVTRRPPTRKAREGRRGTAWRGAKSPRDSEQRDAPRRAPELRASGRKALVQSDAGSSDKVESLWVSPWTKQTFPSSKSIIHVVGEGSRQQFKCAEDAAELSDVCLRPEIPRDADHQAADTCLKRPASSSTTAAGVKPAAEHHKHPTAESPGALPGALIEAVVAAAAGAGASPQDKVDAMSTAGRTLIGKVLGRAGAARTRAPYGLRSRKQAATPLDPYVDTFECKVCTDYLTPPVRQCVGGHGLCAACLRGTTDRCPVCSRPVPLGPTPALDQLVRTILFPCKNSGAGCRETYLIDERARHEAKCPFRPRPCPCATRSQVMCLWSGLRSTIRGHMRRAHGHHGVVYPYRTFFPLEDFNRAAWAGRTYHVEIVFVEHEIFELHKVFDERNACLWGLLRHILARDATALFSYTIRFQPVNMRPVVSFRNDVVAGGEDLDKAFAEGKRFNLHLDCFTKWPLDIFTVQLKVQPRDKNKDGTSWR